jgi:hypothetical protein
MIFVSNDSYFSEAALSRLRVLYLNALLRPGETFYEHEQPGFDLFAEGEPSINKMMIFLYDFIYAPMLTTDGVSYNLRGYAGMKNLELFFNQQIDQLYTMMASVENTVLNIELIDITNVIPSLNMLVVLKQFGLYVASLDSFKSLNTNKKVGPVAIRVFSQHHGKLKEYLTKCNSLHYMVNARLLQINTESGISSSPRWRRRSSVVMLANLARASQEIEHNDELNVNHAVVSYR